LENVPALLKHDGGRTYEKIRKQLEESGYKVSHKILKCTDFGIPQMRKRVFILATKGDSKTFFDLQKFESNVNLSEFMGKAFVKDTAYTIRSGGRSTPIDTRHNWDGYVVDGELYRLTIEDCLKLQGFRDYELVGTKTQCWKMIGNTIPTNFTDIIGRQLLSLSHS